MARKKNRLGVRMLPLLRDDIEARYRALARGQYDEQITQYRRNNTGWGMSCDGFRVARSFLGVDQN